MPQQEAQAAQVLRVMVADTTQLVRAAATQIGQPCRRCLAAGQVVLADDAEQPALDRRQPTVLPHAAVAPADRMQQVDVRAFAQRIG